MAKGYFLLIDSQKNTLRIPIDDLSDALKKPRFGQKHSTA